LVLGLTGLPAWGVEPDSEAVRKLMEKYEREAAPPKPAPKPKPKPKLKPRPQQDMQVPTPPADFTVFRDKLRGIGSDGPAMVVIPAGEFWMGSPENEAGRRVDERRHRVLIKKAFALGQYEVTVGEFRRFVEASGYRTEAEKGQGCGYWTGKEWKYETGKTWWQPGFTQADTHPVVCVSWNDAVAYTKWISKETGQDYRLPTEAEWEYAARAGTETARYWGEDADAGCRYANAADQALKEKLNWEPVMNCQDGYVYTAPVGHYQGNGWKLYDLLGNVWEWTCSGYDEGYGGGEIVCSSKKGASARRVDRGGSWGSDPRLVRAAYRLRYAPDFCGDLLGLRLARTL
jgi:formylglycine-generating enzyme required for sulfatase activity